MVVGASVGRDGRWLGEKKLVEPQLCRSKAEEEKGRDR
jgi:hypothetical protein